MKQKVDVLVAEIGSTTTVVNAFHHLDSPDPRLLGQGQAPTSVSAGDVRIGLRAAIDDLCRNLGADDIEYAEMFATSSAAGGLRTTVHGLVYDMTARAAKEAALGAGAVIQMITAGALTDGDAEQVESLAPNLILLAGGTDYGERETALFNARRIAAMGICPPVIYAGNVQNRAEVEAVFAAAGQKCYVTENVYPRLDELNIEPARRIIHQVFETHITAAPGMAGVRDLVTGSIIPTPGAVMECALLLYGLVGDLCVIDVGGATTDVHSVTDGSDEIAQIQISPEPRAKRTVEGDLGLYVNARNLVDLVGLQRLQEETGLDIEPLLASYKPVPDQAQLPLTLTLCWYAASTALTRHAGKLRYTYGASGRQAHADGKDLTQVQHLVATGGALTRLPGRGAVLERLRDINAANTLLLPRPGQMRLLEDSDYIMASLGVLAKKHPDAAQKLLKKSLSI